VAGVKRMNGRVARAAGVAVLAVAATMLQASEHAARAQAGPAGEFKWQQLGQRTYDNNCAGCHQRSGNGIPGAFPPLVGHAPEIVAQPGGRAYLARLVLFGLSGSITVNGTTYNGTMPPWSPSLQDDQIAAVINHVLTDWDNDALLPKDFKPILPSEVAAARTEALTSAQIYAMRTPGGAGAAPAVAKDSGHPPSFTQAQADRGQAAYSHSCNDCHGSTLDNGEFGGPPLKGSYFAKHWAAGNVAAVFAYMKAKMPLDRPGGLDDETYADILAYILSQNGYPTGDKELAADVKLQEAMTLQK
jgi:mono/diheme cytochrome c family protein